MRQGIIDGARQWLARRENATNRNEIRNFLDRWMLYQENDLFLLRPPSRVRFFRHLLIYNRCYGAGMSLRLRLLNYLNAFGVLLVGYKNFYLLERLRLKLWQVGNRKRTSTLV